MAMGMGMKMMGKQPEPSEEAIEESQGALATAKQVQDGLAALQGMLASSKDKGGMDLLSQAIQAFAGFTDYMNSEEDEAMMKEKPGIGVSSMEAGGAKVQPAM